MMWPLKLFCFRKISNIVALVIGGRLGSFPRGDNVAIPAPCAQELHEY